MAAGCPVVAARSGGIPDIVTDGVNGYLFNPMEENGAIEATKKLLSNPVSREQMRNQARMEAEKWSWQSATMQLRGFYQQLLDQ
jgi:glycosyltransferase involved in cell wall biosynthesis